MAQKGITMRYIPGALDTVYPPFYAKQSVTTRGEEIFASRNELVWQTGGSVIIFTLPEKKGRVIGRVPTNGFRHGWTDLFHEQFRGLTSR